MIKLSHLSNSGKRSDKLDMEVLENNNSKMKDGRGADFVEDTMSTGKGNAKYETVIG